METEPVARDEWRSADADASHGGDDDVEAGVDSSADDDVPVPLDAPLETPIADLVDQMRPEPIDEGRDEEAGLDRS